ncbi:hypothetical protein [Nostoc sp. C117]|uniref:hypothetical protein n=1 Tax=Nostoc sp. C117 TaxID=3349875 RepID=UPI00370D6D1C
MRQAGEAVEKWRLELSFASSAYPSSIVGHWYCTLVMGHGIARWVWVKDNEEAYSIILSSSSPRKLGGVKGKGKREKVLILSSNPSPNLAILGWQTTSTARRK